MYLTLRLYVLERIGPISVALNFDFGKDYVDGIYNSESCPKNSPNHAALLVGYGTENGTAYWTLKNSWGTDWGEHGYFRVVRDINVCGIANYAMFPVIA